MVVGHTNRDHTFLLLCIFYANECYRTVLLDTETRLEPLELRHLWNMQLLVVMRDS